MPKGPKNEPQNSEDPIFFLYSMFGVAKYMYSVNLPSTPWQPKWNDQNSTICGVQITGIIHKIILNNHTDVEEQSYINF
jgi:hypothetical protein